MRRATCTVHDGEGGRCGNRGHCAVVRTLDVDGNELERRFVCFSCRRRMRLPDRDVDFQPGVTELSELIEPLEDDPPAPEFGLPGT